MFKSTLKHTEKNTNRYTKADSTQSRYTLGDCGTDVWGLFTAREHMYTLLMAEWV